MKKIIGKLSRRALGLLPKMALSLAVSSVSVACFYWFHQPDVPEELKKPV